MVSNLSRRPNETRYADEEFLPLSGIQHFHFCERQWGLIHVERQWADNIKTTEGHHIHKKVDDPFYNESRGDVIITRSVPIASYKLGLNGIADVVEYKLSDEGLTLLGHEGRWKVKPVEYKRGKQKIDARDEVQLCAQAMCLEEMLDTNIESADFFYHKTRSRTSVLLTIELRELVISLSEQMHDLFKKGITPHVEKGKPCRSCSLVNLCLPTVFKKRIPVERYIEQHIADIMISETKS